jgi:adenine-specific DNA methylase
MQRLGLLPAMKNLIIYIIYINKFRSKVVVKAIEQVDFLQGSATIKEICFFSRRVRNCVPYFYRRIDIFTRVISAQGKEIREKQKREKEKQKRHLGLLSRGISISSHWSCEGCLDQVVFFSY